MTCSPYYKPDWNIRRVLPLELVRKKEFLGISTLSSLSHNDASPCLQFSLPCSFPLCQFLQYDAASRGGTKDTQLRASGSVGPNPHGTRARLGREGCLPHSTLPQPLQAHGAGKIQGDTSRPAAFPREFINPSRHLGWTGDFPVQGLVLLILRCFLP